MPLSYAFGACPPQSSLQHRLGLPRGRPRRPTAPERAIGGCSTTWQARPPHTLARARLHLALPKLAPSSKTSPSLPSASSLDRLLLPLARPPQVTSPLGPSDACQSTLTWPSRTALRLHADRPGLPLPALPVSRICQPCFMLDRPWAPSLQRFLPARRRRTLSGPAVPLAVQHLAVSRLRGFQRQAPPAPRGADVARRAPPSPCGSDATRSCGRVPLPALFTPSSGRSSPGCFPPSRMASRPRPTLLRDSSHGLQSCVAALGFPCGGP